MKIPRNRHDAIRQTIRRLPAPRIAAILNPQLIDELAPPMREHAKRCHDCRARIVHALLDLAREISSSGNPPQNNAPGSP